MAEAKAAFRVALPQSDRQFMNVHHFSQDTEKEDEYLKFLRDTTRGDKDMT